MFTNFEGRMFYGNLYKCFLEGEEGGERHAGHSELIIIEEDLGGNYFHIF